MKSKPRSYFIFIPVFLLLALGSQSSLQAQTVWLPFEKHFNTTLSYTYETFDDFWRGPNKRDLNATIDQHSAHVFMEYSFLEDFAVDTTLGYTRTSLSTPGSKDLDGLDDTKLGVRWRFLNEYDFEEKSNEWIPSLALRVGGIIEGTYDIQTTGAPHSPGDSANGMEFSLLGGKQWNDIGFGVYGDVGYRFRDQSVPEDFFLKTGIYKTIPYGLTLTFNFQHVQALSGRDLSDPEFTPSKFPELKQISNTINGGIYYEDGNQNSYGVSVGTTVDGRNTGDKLIIQTSATFRF